MPRPISYLHEDLIIAMEHGMFVRFRAWRLHRALWEAGKTRVPPRGEG